MSEYSLDEPGFAPPVPPVPPSSSESSVETPVDGRRKCSSCPRRMSKKSADRHTLCVSYRGFDCDLNNRCEECLEWSEEEVVKYAKYRKSLKSRESSSRKTSMPTPPLTTSGPSPQPAPLPAQQPAPQPAPRPAQRDDIESQVDSLSFNFQSLSETLASQLNEFMNRFLSQSQSSCQPRLGPDAAESHPGRTAGESHMFQGEGIPAGLHWSLHPLLLPCLMTLGLRSRSCQAVLRLARLLMPLRVPQPIRLRVLSHLLVLLRNPPRLVGSRLVLLLLVLVVTRLSLSRRPVILRVSRRCVTLLPHGWLTSFTRSALTRALFLMRGLRVAVLRLGSASLRLRPLKQRFRMYPRVAEVQEEVAARLEALARRAKPLSRINPARARAFAMADDAIFTSSQPVNSAFAQLVGSRALGSRR